MDALPRSDLLEPEPLRTLLRHAARAVAAALRGEAPADEPCPHGDLRREAGVFVTLRHRKQLAGCIGYPHPDAPLWESAASAARAAALEDPRFPRLPAEALDEVDVEISVLTPARPIGAEEIEVGVHGLMLRWRGHGGLLLPQVAPEHGLDRDGFLRALCQKAGVPERVLHEPDLELRAFQAQVDGAAMSELLEESP